MQKPEDTTTGEVIHVCGYIHNEGTACPPPTAEEGNDFKALEVLKPNFYVVAGMLVKKHSSYQPNDLDWVAINYLCDEWDYGYEHGWVGA